MRAALLAGPGCDEVTVRDDVAVVGPGDDEIRVEIRAAGICHSDLSVMTGVIPQPSPTVLGHEAAGVVVEVGRGGTGVEVGDHVILAWVAPCGSCPTCVRGQPYLCPVHAADLYDRPRMAVPGAAVFGMAGIGAWAEEVVVPRQVAVAIPHDVPFDVAALVGCAVTTGVGAVVNTARVEPGAAVLVIGCGGVGLNVVQGARLVGASPILAVDPVPHKRALAARLGATAVSGPDRLAEAAAGLGLAEGFDYAFEVVGRPETIRAAWDATRRGGTTVVVGVGGEEPVEFSAAELVWHGKRLLSSWYGSADVRRDYGRILGLWRTGRLDLAALVSRRLDLAEVNDAIAELRSGRAVRQVIMFGEQRDGHATVGEGAVRAPASYAG
jgi:S-(hydroxymethyl)glutathione dehydrogenase/alcohol dehydrogenase